MRTVTAGPPLEQFDQDAVTVVFVAGCVEPGQSGVGDYTRLLAGHCSRLGHRCMVLAIADPFVTDAESSWEGEVNTRRLPLGSLANGVAIAEWRRIQESFHPDWMSLQFVPFAFHSKGIAWPALKPWVSALGRVRRHVMLHEVWIGEHQEAPLKERLLGRIQRWSMVRLRGAIKPCVSHTSIVLYERLLGTIGWKADVLPLFGNIPVEAESADDWLMSRLRKLPGLAGVAERRHLWVSGIFGSLHDSFDYRSLFQATTGGMRRSDRMPVCLWFGRGSGDLIWSAIVREFGNEICFYELGELPASKISEVINFLDAGIITTPADIVGKSGAAAAMRDHGIPLLVPTLTNRYPRWLGEDDLNQLAGVQTALSYFSRPLPDRHPGQRETRQHEDIVVQFLHSLSCLSTGEGSNRPVL